MLTATEKGAAIGLFAAALVNMDYALRQMQQAGTLRHGLKHQLNILHNHADKFLLASQREFGGEHVDVVNALSEVIGEAGHLLLQMKPAQIQACLTHMHHMLAGDAADVPAPPTPVAAGAPLESLVPHSTRLF